MPEILEKKYLEFAVLKMKAYKVNFLSGHLANACALKHKVENIIANQLSQH